jgi:hypothetical protein
MVKFRISLRLYNYNDVSQGPYSKLKAKKILKFYEAIGQIIKTTHNCDVKRTNKMFKEYHEPLIKIRKIIFTKPEVELDNPTATFLDALLSPTMDLDLEFKMSGEEEEVALKQFYKDYKGSMKKKSYKELRSLYYSSKIIQFVNRLRGLVEDGILWKRYLNSIDLKTKYKPSMVVSDTTVLSLT